MKAPLRPAGSHPWEQPDFVWFTDEMKAWLDGYTPTAADTHRTDGRIAAKHAEASRRGGDACWNKK